MKVSAPYALTAEITHRCPLQCGYCSNPIELQKRENELPTEDWLRVLEEASELGVVQVHFTGGEPLLRPDLEQLIRRARGLDLFVNLISSGVGLTEKRMQKLAEAGTDSIQLSIQASTAELADRIGGINAHEIKRKAAGIIRAAGMTLNMNVVLHRHNLHEVEEMIELCASWGAERLELANTQYYGWALANRDDLMPAKQQVIAAEAAFYRARERFGKQMELIWVLPDYHENLPKPCMGGWGKLSMTVSPNGMALPCTVAGSIQTLRFESVKDRKLSWIWEESESFQAYRGFDWMPEPCKTCDMRFQDFGGCRCQAFLLTGDAMNTDPVCERSPHHHLITEAAATLAPESVHEAAVATRKSHISYRG